MGGRKAEVATIPADLCQTLVRLPHFLANKRGVHDTRNQCSCVFRNIAGIDTVFGMIHILASLSQRNSVKIGRAHV